MSTLIERASDHFSNWVELLRLLQDAFGPMEARIDLRSSVLQMTPESLAAKSREETLFLVRDRHELIGCVFARPQGDALYVGELAVRNVRQRNGVARQLMAAVEAHARAAGVIDEREPVLIFVCEAW